MRTPLTIPPGKAALLLIDLQEEHRQDQRFLADAFDGVIANAERLLEAARGAMMPVYHCAYIVDPAAARPFHPVTPEGRSMFSDASDPLTAICAEVAPTDGETLLVKTEASAFGDGRLAPQLTARGIEWLIVAGVWTEACVAATVRDAIAHGIRVLLVKDACGSGTKAMHQTGIINLANRLSGGAVANTASACRLIGGETTDVWVAERPAPLLFGYADAEKMYEAL